MTVTKRELMAFLADPEIHNDTIIIMSDQTGSSYTYIDEVTMESDEWLIEYVGRPAVVVWPVY
jgi:hypothetical protein